MKAGPRRLTRPLLGLRYRAVDQPDQDRQRDPQHREDEERRHRQRRDGAREERNAPPTPAPGQDDGICQTIHGLRVDLNCRRFVEVIPLLKAAAGKIKASEPRAPGGDDCHGGPSILERSSAARPTPMPAANPPRERCNESHHLHWPRVQDLSNCRSLNAPASSAAQRSMASRKTVVKWLLDSDPAIRWQVMRDLTDEPD